MDKQKAKERIKKLIDKYEGLTEAERKHYNEQQTKDHFIRPLFEALGWDFEVDVWPETSVSKKRGDYAFKINGITKFFVEAKQLSVDLDELKWAEQAIWYAWHKSVPWAILTDFEGLKIYNAEWDEKDPERNLVLDLKYSDYLTNDRLWWLSRESIEKGDLDRYAEGDYKRPKRAKVDKQLVADLLFWRDKLYGEFEGFNPSVKSEKISENVQRFLNRLIFIRTCEDREFENIVLQEAVRNWKEEGHKNNELVKKLRKIFIDFDKDYDSKLFEEKIIFDSEKFIVDDHTLAWVVEETYKSSSGIRWKFGDIKEDVLGSIYEQYLGSVQKREKNDEKADKSKRKSQGIYYTPEYIVDYIVRSTLAEALKNKKTEEIKDIKILDPACGSGSFLIRAYRELIEYWQNQKNKKSHYKKGTHLGTIEKTLKQKEGIELLSSQDKMDILRNNIYGVDLDEKAVEIAQLNLLLKTVDKRMKLPNLQHILCGNSLISGGDQELKKYFSKKWPDKKRFNWQEKFPEVFKNGGFDIIIGNPPYIDSEIMTKEDPDFRSFCVKNYLSARGNWDMFCIFIERSLSLLKDNGYFSMIIPNKLLNSDYAKEVRKILKEFEIISVRDYSRIPVFNASVYPVVITVRKSKASKDHKIHTEIIEHIERGVVKFVDVKQEKLGDNWIFSDKSSGHVIGTFKSAKPLKMICNVHGAATVSEAYAIKPLIMGLHEESGFFKFLNTGTIDRYCSLWAAEKTRYIKNSYIKPRVLKEELKKLLPKRFKESSNKKIVIAGMVKQLECFFDKNGEYLAGKSTTIVEPFEDADVDLRFILGILNSKLMTRIYKQTFGSLTLQGGYLRIGAPQIKEMPIILPSNKEIRYVIKLVDKIIVLHEDLLNLDPEMDDKEYNEKKSEIEKIDKEIDQKVYELYGLTEGEIKIIENS